MYEFLGLSRLGRIIVCLVCVGDKNQLPPYDPGCSRTIVRHIKGSKQGGRHKTFRPTVSAETIKSLLDASQLTLDGKIKLTTQYRVPRDIANLLDARIYKGDYVTPLSCKVPLNGFHFVHVTVCKRRKKYVNENEIRLCLDLAENSLREGSDSIMVLTPVSLRKRLTFLWKQNCVVLSGCVCQLKFCAFVLFISSTRSSKGNSNLSFGEKGQNSKRFQS